MAEVNGWTRFQTAADRCAQCFRRRKRPHAGFAAAAASPGAAPPQFIRICRPFIEADVGASRVAWRLQDPASNMIPRRQISDRSHSQTGRSDPNDRSPIRVWLVDDNKNYRQLLASFLGDEEGMDCSRQYPSAEAVLDALSQGSLPDVILLDIDMGGLSGLDAIGPIKARAGSVRVVMLTCFGDPGRKDLALQRGADDFLLKSYPVEEISQRVRNVCELSAAEGPALTGEQSQPASQRFEPPGSARPARPRPCAFGTDDETTPSPLKHERAEGVIRSGSGRFSRSARYLRRFWGWADRTNSGEK